KVYPYSDQRNHAGEVTLVVREVTLPERAGRVVPERRKIGPGKTRRAGRGKHRGGKGKGGGDDSADRGLKSLLQLVLAACEVELAAAALGCVCEVGVGRGLLGVCDAEGDGVDDDVLHPRDRGRVVLGVTKGRLVRDQPRPTGLHSVRDED